MCGNGGNAGGWLTAAGAAISDWLIQVANTQTGKLGHLKMKSKLHAQPIDENSQATTIRSTQGKIHKTSTTPRATHHIV